MYLNSLSFSDTLLRLWEGTGIAKTTNVLNYIMIVVAIVLLYLAIARGFEPLLLLPIAFGMLLINIPGAREVFLAKADEALGTKDGLFTIIGYGVNNVVFPPLVFLGIGAMTDFGPLIANPKSLLVGAGAQLGIFVTLIGAIAIFGFTGREAGSIAIIGGADGPTAIMVATLLKSENFSAIVIAAYSYMALIPIIQPPFMKLLTTKKERLIRMKQMRTVSKKEKIIFPILVSIVCGLIVPDALPLIGMLMLGNLLKESLVTERLAQTASNALINIITIFLGLIVGTKADGPTFLSLNTIKIVALGLTAFAIGTVGGILTVKVINLFSKEKMNPLIGSAGVSAVPMAARVSHMMGKKYDPDNYLLMHAMGPNVAGVIGSAVAAGVLLAIFL